MHDRTRFHKSLCCPALLGALKEYLLYKAIIDGTYFERSPSIQKSIGRATVQPSDGNSKTAGEVYVMSWCNRQSFHSRHFLY